MIHIVTLFAQNYMSRGLAMLESIQKHSTSPLRITVLAMDAETQSYLEKAHIPNLSSIQIDDFQDPEFTMLLGSRPFRELCWTAAPCLTNFVFKTDSESDFIIYVDSDCYFFSDIADLFSQWNDESNIFVHEHRYSAGRLQWEATSGRFNVGVVGFRGNSKEAEACLAKWRQQVLDVCELNPELGLCGDQGYLNEWPAAYSGLQIMTSPGEGAAPWNIEDRVATKLPTSVLISDKKLIFYHFHALRVSYNLIMRMSISHLAFGYTIPKSVRKLIYNPYLQHLHRVNKKLKNQGFNLPELGFAKIGIKAIAVGRNTGQIKLILLKLIRSMFKGIGSNNRSRIIQICLEFANEQGPEFQRLATNGLRERVVRDYFAEHPEVEFQNNSYSQNGEDLILSRLLEGHPRGRYIDIGAHHPFRFSNTASLSLSGWSGLNVDPNQDSIKDFEKYRESDDNMCIALGKTDEYRPFYQYEESALNTFANERALELQDLGIHPVSVDRIKVFEAKDFLESRYTNDTYLLTLDVEGLDLEIMKELDYQRFNPCFVIFEYQMQGLQDIMDLISKVEFLNHYTAKSVAFNSVILQSVNCKHAN